MDTNSFDEMLDDVEIILNNLIQIHEKENAHIQEHKNSIMLVMDSFHTEISKDFNKYAKWYVKQLERNLDKINYEEFANKKIVTKDDIISHYLQILTKDYVNEIILESTK